MAGDFYSIADMALWSWVGGLVKGLQYDAGEFLDVGVYKNVKRWADEIYERPAFKRGQMVNRTKGAPSERLSERHSPQDFDIISEN